jgi:peptidylprolyl isomerase
MCNDMMSDNVVFQCVRSGTMDDGTEFDSSRKRGKPFKFVIGCKQVIKGWDQGFMTMRMGEKAILRCRSDYAYGKNGSGSIPPGATLNFDVELISSAPKKKERHEMNDTEREQEATKLKEEGTKLFQTKEFARAIALYNDGAELVESIELCDGLYTACKLNAAQAAINIQDYASAVTYATEALKKDETNVKAYYRRGVARNHLGLSEEAMLDLQATLELDPENKPAKLEIAKVCRLLSICLSIILSKHYST